MSMACWCYEQAQKAGLDVGTRQEFDGYLGFGEQDTAEAEKPTGTANEPVKPSEADYREAIQAANDAVAQARGTVQRSTNVIEHGKQTFGLGVKPLKIGDRTSYLHVGENPHVAKVERTDKNGKKQDVYLTESGNEYDTAATASREQNALDKQREFQKKKDEWEKEKQSTFRDLDEKIADLEKKRSTLQKSYDDDKSGNAYLAEARLTGLSTLDKQIDELKAQKEDLNKDIEKREAAFIYENFGQKEQLAETKRELEESVREQEARAGLDNRGQNALAGLDSPGLAGLSNPRLSGLDNKGLAGVSDAIAKYVYRWLNPEYGRTRAALQSAKDAEQTVKNATKEGLSNTWVANLLQGAWDATKDIRTWDFGANDLANGANINSLLDKQERIQEAEKRGETPTEKLTASEQKMLDALALSSTLDANFQEFVPMSYRVGHSVPESAGFAASIYLNPLNGLGRAMGRSTAANVVKGGTKAVLKGAVRAGENAVLRGTATAAEQSAQRVLTAAAVNKYGKWGVRAMNAAGRVTGDAIEALGTTLTTGLPRTLATISDRQTGQIIGGYDSNGDIVFNGTDGREKGWKSVAKGVLSSYWENESEMWGEYFAPVSNFAKQSVKDIGFARRAVEAMSASDMGGKLALLNKFREKAHISGLFGEYAEEVLNNFADALTVGDMNFTGGVTEPKREDYKTDEEYKDAVDKWKGSVFNAETNLETFLSVAAMMAPMAAVERSGRYYNAYTAKRQLNTSIDALTKALGQDKSESLVEALRNAESLQDMGTIILQASQDGTIANNKQARALLNVASKMVASQSVNTNDAVTNLNRDRLDRGVLDAFSAGHEIEAENRHQAAIEYDQAYETAARLLGSSVAESIPLMSSEDLGRFMRTMPQEQKEAAQNLFLHSMRLHGIYAQGNDAALEATDKFANTLREVQDENGQVFRGSNLNENEYIVPSSLQDGSSTIVVRDMATDVLRMIPREQAGDITSTDTAQELNDMRQKLIADARQQIQWSLNHNNRTVDPQVGQTVTVSADNEEGNAGTRLRVVREEDDGTLLLLPTRINGKTGEEEAVSGEPIRATRDELLDMQDDYYDQLEQAERERQQAQQTHDTALVQDEEEQATDNEEQTEGDDETAEATPDTRDTAAQELDSTLSGRSARLLVDSWLANDDAETVHAQIDGVDASQWDAEMKQRLHEYVDSRVTDATTSTGINNTADNEVELSSDGKGKAGENSEKERPRDADGNLVYDQVPVQDTVEDLYDGTMTDEEVGEFVRLQAEEAGKALARIEGKTPKMTTNKAKYMQAKARWEADVKEARRKADYWHSVADEVKRVSTGTQAEQETATRKAEKDTTPQSGEQLAAQVLASSTLKPESYRAETGYKLEEQKKHVGLISNEGQTIDQLAERLAMLDTDQHNGQFFHGDSFAAKDAILSVLQQAGTRGEILRIADGTTAQNAQDAATDRYEEQTREQFYQENYGMSYEDYLAYEEQELPAMLRHYHGFDEQAFMSMYADEIENGLKARENDTTGEERGTDGGTEVLRDERTDKARGDEGRTERDGEAEAGHEGSAAQETVREEDASEQDRPADGTLSEEDARQERLKAVDSEIFPEEFSLYGTNSRLHDYQDGVAIYVDSEGRPSIYLAGSSNGDYVGVFRDASGRWSSKMENQSGNKETFRQQISSVMRMLPEGAEFYEHTNVSADGLRVFAQQLRHGFKRSGETYECGLNGEDKAGVLGDRFKGDGRFDSIYAGEKDLAHIRKALKPFMEALGMTEDDVRLNEDGKVVLRLPVLVKDTKAQTDNQGNPVNADGSLRVEQVRSVDELTDEDFSSPTRSVQLPALPANVDAALGAEGKPVVIKKNIFAKNWAAHKFPFAESREILRSALYNPDLYGQTQPSKKPLHWVVIKTGATSPLVVLEVNSNKDNIEIVGWYTLDGRNLERIKRQAQRNGGELVMLSPKDRVESLSTPTQGLSSEGKDTPVSSDGKGKTEEKAEKDEKATARGDIFAEAERQKAEEEERKEQEEFERQYKAEKAEYDANKKAQKEGLKGLTDALEAEGVHVDDSNIADQTRRNVGENGLYTNADGSTTVYHGTQAEGLRAEDLEAGHTRADGGKAGFNGEGVYFTPTSDNDYGTGEGQRMLACHLRLKKPFYTIGNMALDGEKGKKLAEVLRRFGYDSIINYSNEQNCMHGYPSEIIALDSSVIVPLEEDESHKETGTEEKRQTRPDDAGRQSPLAEGTQKERMQAAGRIAKALGAKLVIVDHMEENGRFSVNRRTGERTITIARDAEDPLAFVFGHESLHAVRSKSEEAYQNLRAMVMAAMGGKAWNTEVAKAVEMYKGQKGYDSPGDYEEEVVAQFLGSLLNDRRRMASLAQRLDHPTLAAIMDVLRKIRDFFRQSGMTAQERWISGMQETVENAYRQAAKADKGQGTGSRASLRQTDSDIFEEAQRMKEEEELNKVNKEFNERLAELYQDPSQKNRVLKIGKPGRFLLDGGLTDAEIELEFDRLLRKSKESYENKHPFDVRDIQDLPKSLNAPIAVFTSTNGKDDGNVILTELKKKGKNFIVAVRTTQRNKKGGVKLEVNEITTLFPKDERGIIKWINSDSMSNVDKRKALPWIEALRNHHGTELTEKELSFAAKVVENFEKPAPNEEKSSEVLSKSSLRNTSDKTLVGVHNISEEKLLKALKLGGLANPSVAVIDSDKQTHTGYGGISLILPSSMVAKRTGKNAGTFFGDAWTPTYPQVERQFGKGGSERAAKDIDSVPEEMQRMTRNAIDAWMDGRDADGLAYLYLQEKDQAPSLVRMAGKYDAELHQTMRELTHGKSLYNLDEEGKKEVLDLLIKQYYEGDRKAFDKDIAQIKERLEERLSKIPNQKSLLARKAKEDLDWIEGHGYDYDMLSRFVDDVNRDAKTAGEVSDSQTMLKAQQKIEENNLKQDFERWKNSLSDRYDIKEVIFDGFTPSGNRRYVPNDLAHASRIMKKKGLAGAEGAGFTFNQFAATLMEQTGNLAELRKRKDMLTEDHADMDTFTDKWTPVYNSLAEAMNPNSTNPFDDTGYYRLAETAIRKDPKAYAKEEYGVDLTEQQVKGLHALVNAIRTERPAMYFETKFDRPVGFEEFASAVVPNNLGAEARQGLEKAGLSLYEYDPKKEGDRKRAFREATDARDDIKFSLRQPGSSTDIFGEAARLRAEETALRDALTDRMRQAGLDVVTDSQEGQRVLDEANGKVASIRTQTKISALAKAANTIHTWLTNNMRGKSFTIELPESTRHMVQKVMGRDFDSHNITANGIAHAKKNHGVSGNKLGSNSIALRDEDFELLPYIMIAPDYVQKGTSDMTGRESIRFYKTLSNGYVVVAEKEYKNSPNDMETITMWADTSSSEATNARRNAPDTHVRNAILSTEDAAKIRKDAEIAIANDQKLREHRVYHGSGADFEQFDHSHMGEGEGAQAYGWGTYVTEVEGIGRTYAEQNERQEELSDIERESIMEDIADDICEHYGIEDGIGALDYVIDGFNELELRNLPAWQRYFTEHNDEFDSWDSPEDFDLQDEDSATEFAEVASRSIIDRALKIASRYDSALSSKHRHLYTVEIPEDTGENYLDWDKKVPAKTIQIVAKAIDANEQARAGLYSQTRNLPAEWDSLARLNFALDKMSTTTRKNTGGDLYDRIGAILGSNKSASEFLSSLGFTGIKYPAQYQTGGRTDGAKNYVIFDEKDLEITDNVRFFRTADGEAYGYTVDGKIYIDPRVATAETPIHEYAHLWATALQRKNSSEWKNVKELMKGTPAWDEARLQYPELESDDEVADEVLAMYSGRRGAERLREEQRKVAEGKADLFGKAEALQALDRVRQALTTFWQKVADMLHLHFTTPEEVADRVMRDLLEGVDPRDGATADGKVRRQFIGEEGAKKADHAEEVTARLDNLAVAREDQVFLLGNDTESRASLRTNLRPDTKINVVAAVQEHGFKNYKEAKDWARGHIARTYSNQETGGKGEIRISNTAIDKYLSESAVTKSESQDAHLSVLRVLPDVIRESVDAEQHPDYKKNAEGVRSVENGVNPDVMIHRLYGAVRIGDNMYRVKVTLKENAHTKETTKAYSYEATKIELLDGQHGDVTVTSPRYSSNSISAAKLLKGVEKSYGGGKFFADTTEKASLRRGTSGVRDIFQEAQDARDEEEARFSLRNNNQGSGWSRETMQKAWDNIMGRASFMAKEGYWDYLASVEEFQKLMEKATGRSVSDLENAYQAMLALSSRNANEMKLFDSALALPLQKAVLAVAGAVKDFKTGEGRALAQYLIAKHGIERNRDMAVRAALKEHADKDTDLYTQLLSDWYDEADRIRQQAQADGWTWRQTQEALTQAAETYGADMGKDYSGLTGMMTEEDADDRLDTDTATAQAYDMVEDYEKAHEHLDGLWQAVHDIAEYSLDKQQRSGLVGQDYVDDQHRRYEYFVPLRGFADPTAEDMYGYLDGQRANGGLGSPVKTAKGRVSEAADPLGNLLNVAYRSIASGNKNMALQHFYNLVNGRDTSGLAVTSKMWVENVGTDANPDWVLAEPQLTDPMTGGREMTGEEVQAEMERFEADMEAKLQAGTAKQLTGGKSDPQYRIVNPGHKRSHQVRLNVGGRARVVTIAGNPRVAMALNGLLNPENSAWPILQRANNFMASAFTNYNVSFGLANLARDTMQSNMRTFIMENPLYWAKFTMKQGLMLGNVANCARMIKMMLDYDAGRQPDGHHERMFKEFLEGGGATGYTMIRSQEEASRYVADIVRDLKNAKRRKLSPMRLFDLFSFLNESTELVNRFLAYETSREMGRTVERSVDDAKEATLNFNRKGAGVKSLTDKEGAKYRLANALNYYSQYGRSFIVFFNAFAQSQRQLYKMMTEHPAKFTAAFFVAPVTAAAVALPAINNLLLPALYGAAGGDGDDDNYGDYYEELSDWERQHNICIRLPKGHGWLKIPMSQELATPFALGDVTGAALNGGRGLSASDASVLLDLVTPNNINAGEPGVSLVSFLPSGTQFAGHIAINRDFKGSKLYNDSPFAKYQPNWRTATRNTSKSLVALSRAANSLAGGSDERDSDAWYDWKPGYVQEMLTGLAGGWASTALAVSDAVLPMHLAGGGTEKSFAENAQALFDRGGIPVVSRFLIPGSGTRNTARAKSDYLNTVKPMMGSVESELSLIKGLTKDAAKDVARTDRLLKEAEKDGDVVAIAEAQKAKEEATARLRDKAQEQKAKLDEMLHSDRWKAYMQMRGLTKYIDAMMRVYGNGELPANVTDSMRVANDRVRELK